VALAVIFYGGIAGGVVLMSLAPAGTTTNLESYLFGAITTTSADDVGVFAVLAALLVAVVLVLRPWLFAVAVDEEHARAIGLPTRALTTALAVLTAVTVVLSMRTVGLLLISALMVLPVATAQRLCRSFTAVIVTAAAIGLAASVGGVTVSAAVDTPAGGTIVLLALAAFALAALSGTSYSRAAASRQVPDTNGETSSTRPPPVPRAAPPRRSADQGSVGEGAARSTPS
jgi:zinc transport system permease protein